MQGVSILYSKSSDLGTVSFTLIANMGLQEPFYILQIIPDEKCKNYSVQRQNAAS